MVVVVGRNVLHHVKREGNVQRNMPDGEMSRGNVPHSPKTKEASADDSVNTLLHSQLDNQ